MAPVAGAATEGVAVIGLAGRFPGAPDVRSWWRNLRDGVESIRALGDDELRRSGESAARLADPRYVRAAAVLQDVEAFDAAFFSYSPRDARLLDPQQRLFLETAWAALEDAGHGARNSAGTVGVWAAGSLSRYLVEQLLPAGEGLDDLTTLLGNDKDFLAARVAWHLGLTGPSITVQSGCSSSLLAVAQACQALAAHQCDLALAGGVSLRLPQERGYVHVPDSILSPDGHCRPFDARAAGTVFGSGVGVVVLRRLADALAAGDTIHAVVRGAAVNNDGDSKQGFTAPSVERQAAVVAMAHALAGLESRAISFVEAHGTATALGDAVEVAALTQAFRIGGARTGQCVLGSVKGNVGHLDVASGIAGLLKAVLALEHACIPPTLHFERPNPALGLEDGPFRVNAAVEAWKRDDGPRRAGVSSLGMGGTNVHVVLEQAPPPVPTTPSRAWQLLPLSARTEAGLDAATDALAAHLRREADVPLADVAFTLQAGRRAFEHRRAFVVPADGRPEQLVAAAARGTLEGRPGSARPSVAFLFPGQGSQHAAMAAGLYATERVFREHVDACCELLQPHLGLDLRPLLDPASGRLAGDEDLARTELAQPALFVVEYALARLWMDWGVQPETFFGHSVGEYVAACLTQVFRLEHALPLVALRGRLLAALPPGAMCAVPLAPAELEPLLEGGLALAAVNAPRQCVAAGPIAAVERLEAQLAARGLAGRRLAVTRAFHSPMVEPVLAEFAEAVRRVPRKPPEKLFVSGVTGTWITAAQAVDPDYWARQLRATVRCADGLRLLRGEPARVLLEVGPGRTLTDLAGEADGAAPAVASLRHPRDGRDDVAVLLEALGRLWVAGVPVDWPGFARRERRRRVPLPTYPFARTRHWLGPSADGTRRDAAGRVELSRWFHVPGWSRAPAAPPATLARGTRWLVLAGDDGAWEPLLARLREAGQELLVEAASRADARRLAEAVAARGVTRILHLPLATTGELSDADAVRLGHTLLVELVEALAARGRAGVTLDVLARRAHDVTGEPPAPERATLLGAFRCLPQEHPGLRMRLLDVDVPDSATAPPAAVEAVLRELALADGEPLVALRGGHRWRPTLEPLALESPAALPALRPGGTYLLTGGLGGVGLTLAGFLARTLHANLVLVGRRGLPPPERRDEAPAGGDAETHAALRAVRELQAAGAQVLVEAADVASRADLQRVVDAAHRRFGALDGVIHAAGVAAEGLARRPGEPLSDAPLRAKVQGTRVLADVLGDEPAFVVLCSATATALGGLGQAAYVAGNAYLDAFATARAGGRTRWLSLAWDTWRDVGMARRAVVPEALRARQQQVLAEGLDGAEAVEVFRRALAAPHAHLLVSTTPIAERRARVAAPAPAVVPAGEPIAAAPGRGAPPAAGAAPPPEAPADEVEAGIAHIWTQLLGLSSARRDDSFFEHGGNSLLATQMLARLRERFPDSEVSLPALFARPTIAGLAEQIRKGRPASAVPAAATAPGTATLRERVLQATGTAREALLVEVLTGQLAEAFGRERLPAGGRLEGLDPQLLAAHLSQALRRDLALAVYPPEIRARATVAELARLVDEALQRAPAPTPGARLPAAPQQPAAVAGESPANGARAPIAFLLSSPRSGSTLLRLMLSAHPELFCPPELFLLDHEGLRAWASDSFAPFYRDGLVRALMVRLSLPFEAASRRVDELVARDAPAREVYELLLEGGSLLVDKTPTYALDARALLRAETLFDRPRYVGLVRHPYAVIDSMVRNRLDRVRGVDGDPHELAERTWFEASRNLLELGRRVGERFHLVHYERLVRAPEQELRALCRFLQVPFDPAVLDPYGKGRMFGGPGDPNIHARGALDARLGERWRDVRLPRPLGAEPGRLALSLDYELPLVSGG